MLHGDVLGERCSTTPKSPIPRSRKLTLQVDQVLEARPVCCFTLLRPTFTPEPTERLGAVPRGSLQVDPNPNGCDNWVA